MSKVHLAIVDEISVKFKANAGQKAAQIEAYDKILPGSHSNP